MGTVRMNITFGSPKGVIEKQGVLGGCWGDWPKETNKQHAHSARHADRQNLMNMNMNMQTGKSSTFIQV